MELRKEYWYVAHFEVARKVQIHYYSSYYYYYCYYYYYYSYYYFYYYYCCYYYYYYRRDQRFLTGAFSGSATICYAEIGCLAVLQPSVLQPFVTHHYSRPILKLFSEPLNAPVTNLFATILNR